MGNRIENCITDYVQEEHRNGRMVTFAEIVGTLEIIKQKYV